MNANFLIKIQLADSAGALVKLEQVSIDAVLYVQARVRYRFHAGVTDDHGRLVVSFEQLEKARLENQSFSLMDYNTRLEDCDPEIGLVVPTLAELQQRRAAIKKWFPSDVATTEKITESNKKTVCKPARVNVDLNPEVEIFLTCEISRN